MEECKGCKFDLTNRVAKDNEELCSIIDRCSNCKRAVYPPDVTYEKDLYEPIKE